MSKGLSTLTGMELSLTPTLALLSTCALVQVGSSMGVHSIGSRPECLYMPPIDTEGLLLC